MRILLLFLTLTFAAELEVEGDLKVTGSVDANGNPITNVGEPVLITDVATANYVNSRTAGKGRIITLKCPWHISNSNQPGWDAISSCEPPSCPDGWNDLVTSNEVTGGMTIDNGEYVHVVGNSVRYCIEQEDEE